MYKAAAVSSTFLLISYIFEFIIRAAKLVEMSDTEQISTDSIDLISLAKLLLGNSLDYLLVFLPLYILYRAYIKYNTTFKRGEFTLVFN